MHIEQNQQQGMGFNLIFSIFQSWKDQVDDQIMEIKKNIYSIGAKNLYYYTLELEIKNRKSLKLLIELSQENEQNTEGIPDQHVQQYLQRFIDINADEIPFVSVGTNVNQQKKLKLLARDDQKYWERIYSYSEQMKLMYKNLEIEIMGLSNQIGNCQDKKNKKLLVNQRYRKEENLYYFKLLVGTLNNLTLIYEILLKYQNKVPIQESLQIQLDQQIHDQMNQGMYIRTNTTGRRDKTFLKIVISCLVIVALYQNTSNLTTIETTIYSDYQEESESYQNQGLNAAPSYEGDYSDLTSQAIFSQNFGSQRDVINENYNLQAASNQMEFNVFSTHSPGTPKYSFSGFIKSMFSSSNLFYNEKRKYDEKPMVKFSSLSTHSNTNTITAKRHKKVVASEIEGGRHYYSMQTFSDLVDAFIRKDLIIFSTNVSLSDQVISELKEILSLEQRVINYETPYEVDNWVFDKTNDQSSFDCSGKTFYIYLGDGIQEQEILLKSLTSLISNCY